MTRASDTAKTLSGGAVFNEGSNDVDLRVESNGDANMLFVDGGNNSVGLGSSSPDSGRKLHIEGGDTTVGITLKDTAGTQFGINSDDNALKVKSDSSGAELMRIDSSGNVGIGTTPSKQLHLKSATPTLRLEDSDQTSPVTPFDITVSTDNINIKEMANNRNLWYADSGGTQIFYTSGTERMRIVSGGNVLVGTSNQSPAEGTSTGIRLGSNGTSQISSAAEALSLNRTGNNGDVLVFRRGGTVCGEITVNGDNQTTAYQTSSDYRLKENVTYDFDATARLKKLKPCRFNFISNPDNTTVDGFLAHEVSSIVPEAIGGEKDATQKLDNVVLNSNGTVNSSEITEEDWVAGKEDKTYANDTTWVANKTVPSYQGIDQSKLVPLLVKTIQELEARITTLENA